jgi:hypothetical protein
VTHLWFVRGCTRSWAVQGQCTKHRRGGCERLSQALDADWTFIKAMRQKSHTHSFLNFRPLSQAEAAAISSAVCSCHYVTTWNCVPVQGTQVEDARKCVPCRPRHEDGGDGLVTCRVASNISNKEPQTAEKGRLSALVVGRGSP